ncbi:glutamate racemase [Paenibacillus thalictri]|uniref:Glutamate racemase n=1 Tax=Paenibacillus thalictri TaxID=2527873 RepID=A0A4Q9DW72_9BACL|nr:glutamate racemase [Paenibacillus thalictri]TBL81317.1 glutamate racemase [Paenibacillus thalictri]
MRIAVFDSGLGGLTVLNEAVRLLPNERFVYYADTLHVPYGTKPKHEVKQYIFEAVESLRRYDVKALVIACNTATSIAVKELRETYEFPIIGMEPAVKPAVETSRADKRRVLVTATPLTLREAKFQELVAKIDEDHLVDSLPLPELVQYCERLQFDDEIIIPYLRDKLAAFNMNEYGAIVLGCTHFPFYREHFRRLLPSHVTIMDGSAGTVKRLKQVLGAEGMPGGTGSGNADIVWLSSQQEPGEVVKMQTAMKFLQREPRPLCFE